MKRIFLITMLLFFSSVNIVYAGHNPNHNPQGQGQNGQNGKDGVDGQDGQDGEDGQDGQDGVDGKNGVKGDKGSKGDTGKGLKDRHEVQFEGVIYEDAKSAISTYYIRDFNNENNTVGVKYKYYFGKSHSEKVREDLQRQIDELKQLQQSNKNNFEEDNMVVIPTETGFIMKRRF